MCKCTRLIKLDEILNKIFFLNNVYISLIYFKQRQNKVIFIQKKVGSRHVSFCIEKHELRKVNLI